MVVIFFIQKRSYRSFCIKALVTMCTVLFLKLYFFSGTKVLIWWLNFLHYINLYQRPLLLSMAVNKRKSKSLFVYFYYIEKFYGVIIYLITSNYPQKRFNYLHIFDTMKPRIWCFSYLLKDNPSKCIKSGLI